MKNPYQLTGYTTNGKSTLLGTFDTHEQAVKETLARKADLKSVYCEYRIAKMYQYQVACFDETGQLRVLARYRTQAQAENVYQELKAEFPKAEISHIGGLSDD